MQTSCIRSLAKVLSCELLENVMQNATIKTELPKESKTYVQLKDSATGKTRGTTVYGLTVDQTLEALSLGIKQLGKKNAAHAA